MSAAVSCSAVPYNLGVGEIGVWDNGLAGPCMGQCMGRCMGGTWVYGGAWFGDVCTHAFSPPQYTSPPHHHHHACTMPCADPCTNPCMAQLARHPRPQSCPHLTYTEQHYMILLLVLSHISSFVNLFPAGHLQCNLLHFHYSWIYTSLCHLFLLDW